MLAHIAINLGVCAGTNVHMLELIVIDLGVCVRATHTHAHHVSSISACASRMYARLLV